MDQPETLAQTKVILSLIGRAYLSRIQETILVLSYTTRKYPDYWLGVRGKILAKHCCHQIVAHVTKSKLLTA